MNIQFDNTADREFLQILHRRVDDFIEKNGGNRFADWRLFSKSILFLSLYFGCIALIYSQLASFPLVLLVFALAGVLKIGMALNIGHDAAHGSCFRSPRGNEIALHVFDLIGASSHIWRLRHVHSHHVFPNVPQADLDISQTRILRLHSLVPPRRVYRWQHLYMPFVYLFYTLFWLLLRDFIDLKIRRFGLKKIDGHSLGQQLSIVGFKLFYLGYWLILPIFWLEMPVWQVLSGFIVLHFAASWTVALALVSAHVGEYSEYPEPDSNGLMHESWVRHQIRTTFDFAPENRLVTWFFGGFNLHLVHHLFPNISHIHYPDMTRILKKTMTEFGFEYKFYPSLPVAIASHFRHLKNKGEPVSTFGLMEF